MIEAPTNIPAAFNSSNNVALTALIDRAASALSGARSAAEILEASEMASFAYDMAKKTARLGKAKQAADSLIKTAYRVQADALDIEAGAKRRLADEYDAAQDRGEIGKRGDFGVTSKGEFTATAAEAGLTHKQVHEARAVRDAEAKEPGIVRRVLDEALEAGEEPTRAKVNQAVKKVRRPRGARFEAPQQSQHDRDLQMLFGVWEAACQSAREEFLQTVKEQ